VALDRIKPYLLARDASGLRFSIANAAKDLGYYNAMAQGAGARKDIAAAVLATLESALAKSGPAALLPELATLLA
jgi:3-hydroxyisobutyrate dehydrogenase-like beta-hydroxyacid dehydrogenase